MKCAIMQPTYLPWSGYFNIINQVDAFVFLDDVQFDRRSWQTRNRILLNGKEFLLTVPVKKTSRDTVISNILIDSNSDWCVTHFETLKTAYKKGNYWAQLLSILEPIYMADPPLHLSELNQNIILTIADALKIKTRFFRASDLVCGGKRSRHLIEICQTLGCEEYLSPIGSKDYLVEDNFEELCSIKLTFQSYTPEPYCQYRSDSFVSHLSIIDVIANQGIDFAKNYIKGPENE